jgi:hypothetical protein
LMEDDEFVVSEDSEQAEPPSTAADQTDPESESASESASEERPPESDEPVAPKMTEAIAESELEGSQEASS